MVTDDRIIYVNPAMEQIAGMPSNKMIGLSVTFDFPQETIQHFIPHPKFGDMHFVLMSFKV